MHKILFVGVFLLLCQKLVVAQDLQITAFGGFMNYNGELNSQFRIKNSHPSFSIGAHYNLTGKLGAQMNFTYGKLNAHDSNNVANTAARNLHFSNNIIELNLQAVYHFRDLYLYRWSPFVMGGLGFFHHEPYTMYNGQKVKLRPLGTEGQGLPNHEVKPYSPFQVAIPFGGGVKYNLTDNVQLALEVSLRKLFTDYIDDVGFRYPDASELLNARGPVSVDLSYRGDELNGGGLFDPFPPKGTLRGSVNSKDWFYTYGLKVYIGLNTKGNGVNYMRCPKF